MGAKMELKKLSVKVRGTTNMIMNRKTQMIDAQEKPEFWEKSRSESWMDVETRVWKERAHFNNEGLLFIPASWPKNVLIFSQRLNCFPIKPENAKRKDATMKQVFKSGIMFEDAYIQIGKQNATKDILEQYKDIVTPPGQGSHPSIRPMIPMDWTATLEYYIIDNVIKEKNVLECLEWGGISCGFGDYRPSVGGNFGRFELI